MKIIKFYGENCPACKQLDAWLKQNKYDFYVSKSYSVNTDLGADFASEFKIMSIPALIKLDADNNPQESIIGFDAEKIKKLFEDFINGN
jgi:thioredoxin-like negative regulator of GroEL